MVIAEVSKSSMRSSNSGRVGYSGVVMAEVSESSMRSFIGDGGGGVFCSPE